MTSLKLLPVLPNTTSDSAASCSRVMTNGHRSNDGNPFVIIPHEHESFKTPGDSYLDGMAYHVFEYRGDYILYDLNTTTICLIDELAYELLSRARTETKSTIEKDLSDHYSHAELAAAFAEVETLRARSFFTSPKLPSPEEMDERISQLVNHAPRRIQLLVAQQCNLACTYCYAEEQGSNAINRLMDWETAKRAVDHLIRNSRSRKSLSVNFFGGEPLLNFPLIKKVVEYCVEQGKKYDKVFDFTISTNGTLLNDEKIAFMVKHRFHYLVSIDGDEETHNQQRPTRGGKESYHMVIDKAKKVQSFYKNPRAVKIRANATAQHPSRLKLARTLEKQGFSYIGIGAIEERPAGDNTLAITEKHHDIEVRDNEVLLDAYLEALRTEKRLTFNPWEKALRELKTNRHIIGIRCGACRNTATVGANGKLYPCHRYEGMDAYSIGDVEEGFDRRRIRDYYTAAHQNSVRGCSSCWARITCGGACTWVLNDDKGNFYSPTNYHCDQIRDHLERTLWLFTKMQREYPAELQRIMQD
jgi:uncharacterized protein